MDRVFISYSTKDKYFAELLEIKLKEKGIEVWRDTTALKAGEEWRTSIDTGIRNCFAIVLALSPNSFLSHYVTYEWASGMGLGRTIIPVLLEDCDRHPKIEPIQYIDFRTHTDSSWEMLTERIEIARTEGVSLEVVDADVAVDPKQDESNFDVKIEKAKSEIEAYLNIRGFRMMSFDRIRSNISKDYSDRFLAVLTQKIDSFAFAKLKDGKLGVKLL